MLVSLLLFLVGLNAVTSRHINFYRKDYTYVEQYDAYYKLHWDANIDSWSSAFLACDDEGAELFYPHISEEWTVAKKLASNAHETPNVTDIFVGIHDKFGLGEFLTINGKPLTTTIPNDHSMGPERCVTMNIDSGELKADECVSTPDYIRPFVCKKVEDVTCPTIDKGYIYAKETKKCYKKNDRAMNWSEAMETCYMEGGILAVITSDLEADVIRRNIIGDDKYFAGIKKMFPINRFYTVTGHKVDDSGFERWYDSNNYQNNECGVISSYGHNVLYYNAVECMIKLPFVCEMNVAS